jgi:hypothetical protein
VPRGGELFQLAMKVTRSLVMLQREVLTHMQKAYHQTDEGSPKQDAHTNVKERVQFLPPLDGFQMREQIFSDTPNHHII